MRIGLAEFESALPIPQVVTKIKKGQLCSKEEGEVKVETNLLYARRLIGAQEFATALTCLSFLPPATPEKLTAEVGLARVEYEENKDKEGREKKDQYIKSLKRALQIEAKSSRSLEWRAELIPLLFDGKKTNSEITEIPPEVTQLVEAGKSLALADLVESAGMNSYDQWLKAAEIGKEYRLSPKNAGPALRFLIILNRAKKYEEVLAWADKLLKINPNNLDVLRRKMKIFSSLSQGKNSLTIGENIIKRTEGRNQFWVAEELAKNYLARPEIQEKKLLETRKNMDEMIKKATN